jgi:hypothetical protein
MVTQDAYVMRRLIAKGHVNGKAGAVPSSFREEANHDRPEIDVIAPTLTMARNQWLTRLRDR